MAICETNPTSPFGLSHQRPNFKLRNEPKSALRIVTTAPEFQITKRTQLRPSRCHIGVRESNCETNPTAPVRVSPPDLTERTFETRRYYQESERPLCRVGAVVSRCGLAFRLRGGWGRMPRT
jgi:hypothetical protein